jgi:hypothetical protein
MPQSLPYMCRPDYYSSKYVSVYTGGDFGEDGLDYALSNNTYSLYGQEHVGGSSNYGSHTASRAWTPIPTTARAYFDPEEATYSQSQVQYNNASYGLRSNVSTEPNNFSFSGMANSLPTPAPIITNDRVLPMPAVPRNTSGLTSSRSADALPYMGQPIRTYHDHPIQMAGPHANSVTYLPLSSSPTSADNYTISNINGNLGLQHQDIYNISENWVPAPLANDPTLRTLESSSDQYYRHNSESPRKSSQSRKSTSCGSQSSPSTGHSYRNAYGQETVDLPRNGSADMVHGAIHRRSTGSLHGA